MKFLNLILLVALIATSIVAISCAGGEECTRLASHLSFTDQDAYDTNWEKVANKDGPPCGYFCDVSGYKFGMFYGERDVCCCGGEKQE